MKELINNKLENNVWARLLCVITFPIWFILIWIVIGIVASYLLTTTLLIPVLFPIYWIFTGGDLNNYTDNVVLLYKARGIHVTYLEESYNEEK